MSMKYFSIIVFLIISQVSLLAQNLIINGDFENALENWESWVKNEDYSAVFNVHQEGANNYLEVDVEKIKDEYWAFKFHAVRLKQAGFVINKYDVLRLSFKAKGLGEKLILQAGLARNKPEEEHFWKLEDYDFSNFELSDTWEEYSMDFIATDSTDDVQFVLRFGEKPGNYSVDDISLSVVDNKSELRDWMTEAQERIDTLRKGDFQLVITDSNGIVLPNGNVEIELLSHEFQWGTAVRSITPRKWDRKSYNWERSEILGTFNTIVNEDDFKWPQTEPKQGDVVYENIDLYLDWAKENNLKVRGHCLFWPKKGVFLPDWFEELPKDEAILAVKERVQRDVSYFKGEIVDYDVVNEPVHNPFLEEWLGDSIYYWIYTWTKETDPNAKLYVNEWWNFDYWDSYRFKTFVANQLDMGTPIDGLGLQGHLDHPTNWLQYKFKLDYLAGLGLPLKITEFDIDVDKNDLTLVEQAEECAKMMRIAFSHPAVNGLLIWGIKDGWRDNAGIYNDNETPRPAADTMRYLIKELWGTEVNAEPDEMGRVNFNGYYGDYRVVVSNSGEKDTVIVNLKKSKPVDTIQLQGLTITSAESIRNIDFNLYPNPTKNKLTVEVSNISEMSSLEIIDSNGLLIKRKNLSEFTNPIIFDLNEIKQGLYFVKLGSANDSLVKPFVIRK